MTTLPNFKWLPDLGATPTYQPLVTTVNFGDGYEVRVSESLNRTKRAWDVTFSRPLDEIREINQFLLARGGKEPFRWDGTIGETGAYVCRSWTGPSQQYKGVYVISAQFEEVFES